MSNFKLVKLMSPEERLDWIQRFAAFRDKEYVVLCGVGEYWSSEHVAMIERGLDLLMAWQFARDFVEKTRMFRDYARRMGRFQFYMELIAKELAAMSLPIEAAPSAPRRRGRPTREEAQQMARERAELAEREAVAKVIAGERRVAMPAMQGSLFSENSENSKPTAKSQQPTATPPATPLGAAVAMAAGNGTRLHLDQLAWLLSDGLRARVGTVAALRTRAAEESNQAKELAERGVAQVLIEPHSLAAVDASRAVRAIYDDVDRELGELYSLLSIGGEHVPSWERRCGDKGITLAQLMAVLKPYWEKVGCPTAQVESVPSPAEVENRHERAAKIHRIRTYFMRKDRKLTAERVEKMRSYIEELRGMGVPTEEYEHILEQSTIALTGNAEDADGSDSSEDSEDAENSKL